MAPYCISQVTNALPAYGSSLGHDNTIWSIGVGQAWQTNYHAACQLQALGLLTGNVFDSL